MTSTDLPAYRDLMKRVLPANTAIKNAIFDRYNLDAIVFPYNPTFATPIKWEKQGKVKNRIVRFHTGPWGCGQRWQCILRH